MSYKRVVKKKGKVYGPYIYESYRDENGQVKKRYLGKLEEKKTLSLSLLFSVGILALMLIIGGSYTTDVLMNDGAISGNVVSSTSEFFSNTVEGITGLIVSDDSSDSESSDLFSSDSGGSGSGASFSGSAFESSSDSSIPDSSSDSSSVPDSSEDSSDVSNSDTLVEEVVEEVVIEDVDVMVDVVVVDETPAEDSGEGSGGGSGVGELESNITENDNETVVEENITEEVNETTLNETFLNEIVSNETLEEVVVNETLENITFVNETILNETVVNETLENVSFPDVSTLQYKAVINRPVKWIKKVKMTESNVTVELPRGAENISILTEGEVADAIADIDKYENVVENIDREEVVLGGLLTGDVVIDIRNSEGLLARFWDWISHFTISGNVILEKDMEDNIAVLENSTIVSVGEIVGNETEVAVEYYTEAPTLNETLIEGGKRFVVSAPDELNYTDILSYSMVDEMRVRVNDSRLRLYWYASEADAIASGYIDRKVEEVVDEKLKKEKEDKKDKGEDITEEINEGLSEIVNESVNETLDVLNESGEGSTLNDSIVEAVNDSVELEEDVVEEAVEEKEDKKDTGEKEDKKDKESLLTGGVISGNESFANVTNDSARNSVPSKLGTDVPSSSGARNSVPSKLGTDVPSSSGNDKIKIEVGYVAYDFDEDGYVDYIEWVVPHLSDQVYELIVITRALHLDENYTEISDIYGEVSVLDNNWSEEIPSGDYVRVSFEKELQSHNDITIYARNSCEVNSSISINGTDVPCEIYWKKIRLDALRREDG